MTEKSFCLVPVAGHLFVVGRLDFDLRLLMLTDDGELANQRLIALRA